MSDFSKLLTWTRFRDNVRLRMHGEGLTTCELAEKAGISPSYLSRILSNDRALPSDEVVLKIGKILGFNPPEALLVDINRIPDDRDDIRIIVEHYLQVDKKYWKEVYDCISVCIRKTFEDNKNENNK
jgi:transcriptional regulator with XRE-family HTH domain